MDARRSDSSLISDVDSKKLKRSSRIVFGSFSLCRGPIGGRGTREELRKRINKQINERKIVSWSEARERFDGASCISHV